MKLDQHIESLKRLSETAKGELGENMVLSKLKLRGHSAELTGYHWPYDILVSGTCKIEVKYSMVNSKGYYDFCVSSTPKSDFTVLVCYPNEYFIIPSHLIDVQHIQFAPGKSKYMKYQDKWNYISDYVHAVEKLSRCSFADAIKVVK